jgi:hypothetical protein
MRLPMADLSSNLPRAEAGDPAEVTLALETARTLWANGQGLESVRWIQRAAENAESSGDDLRAVSLARAAADLRAEVSVTPEPRAPLLDAVVLAPYDEFTEQTIVDSPATSLSRHSLQSGVQIAEAPPSSPVLLVPTPPGAARSQEHQALRVAVMVPSPGARQLTVLLLAEGQAAPVGCTEAILVSLDPRRTLTS